MSVGQSAVSPDLAELRGIKEDDARLAALHDDCEDAFVAGYMLHEHPSNLFELQRARKFARMLFNRDHWPVIREKHL